MKKRYLILFFVVFLFLNSTETYAGPGDTITVQTFEFEGFPVSEGWLAPREGYFDFSEVSGKTFAKVLLYYTLKCDNNQYPACGEWDYLSYIKFMEHTGLGNFPSFFYGGFGGYNPEEFSYMNSLSWWYNARIEEDVVFNTTSGDYEFQIGNTESENFDLLNNEKSDSRSIYLWTSDELLTNGFTAGDITGLQLFFETVSGKFNHLKIRIKQTTLTELSDNIDTTGFLTVYEKNTDILAGSWNSFNFNNFFNWDGTSNLLVDISFIGDENSTGTSVMTETNSFTCTAISSTEDKFAEFDGPDAVYIPVGNMADIQNEITICLWQNGDLEQPQADCIFEALNEAGQRVLNVHLPWNNSYLYWDAGNSTGYDRIEKLLTANQFKEQWNHWAFVKNVTTGSMKMYLNGQLLQSGTGKNRTIDLIDSFAIGRGISDITSSNLRFYSGSIDEFQVWNVELTQAEISEWMNKEIDGTHPKYSNLKAYYNFNDENVYSVVDEISAEIVDMNGIPQKMNYSGNRFKNYTTSNERPAIKFVRNTSGYTVNSEVVVDSFPKGLEMIDKFVQLVPGEKPVFDERVFVYPTYFQYTFDENGNATDSVFVEPDATLFLETYIYNTTTPGEEIITPWELGRFITPYGNGLDLGEGGWTWIFDVTDFQNLLQGNNVHLAAGNFQELLDMKVLFIEGTPPRDVIDIEKIWSGDISLKNFDEVVTDQTIELLPEGEMFKLKTTLTGHYFGEGNNCAEFCPNTHSVDVNGNQEFSWEIIQACGDNPLFPQGGTWIYDRAGWCPGMPATVQNLDVTPLINPDDTQVTLDYDVEYDPYGDYVTEIFFVTYGSNNFVNDAEIEDIIAPNDFKLHKKFNPICGRPIIKIKNNGSEVLTSLTIDYGISGMAVQTYEWSGELNFLESEEVTLPAIPLTDFEESENHNFNVTVSLPSGQDDEYLYNNTQTSAFSVVPSYPTKFLINFYTNKRPWENNYKLFDVDGNVIFEKSDFASQTLYVDTMDLEPGCYEFVMYDSGGDGVYNWPENAGNGYIRFYKTDGTTLLVNLEKWFGNSIRHNFTVEVAPVKIESINQNKVQIVPNPAYQKFNLQFNVDNFSDYEVEIYDIFGKTIRKFNLHEQGAGDYQIDLADCKSGIYFVKITSENYSDVKKVILQ